MQACCSAIWDARRYACPPRAATLGDVLPLWAKMTSAGGTCDAVIRLGYSNMGFGTGRAALPPGFPARKRRACMHSCYHIEYDRGTDPMPSHPMTRDTEHTLP